MCKFPGCSNVVKSQGLCQSHGAKTKRCIVEGCDKQSQTTHEGKRRTKKKKKRNYHCVFCFSVFFGWGGGVTMVVCCSFPFWNDFHLFGDSFD